MSRTNHNQPAAPGRSAAATHHPRGTVRGDGLFDLPLPAQHSNPIAIEAAVRSAPRRGTHLYAVLARLLDGPATTADLCAITHRFSARVCDLRKLGHDITTEVQADGTGLFTLREARP